jgi:hypothetical protein
MPSQCNVIKKDLKERALCLTNALMSKLGKAGGEARQRVTEDALTLIT